MLLNKLKFVHKTYLSYNGPFDSFIVTMGDGSCGVPEHGGELTRYEEYI